MRTNNLSCIVATAAVVLSPALMLSMKGGAGYCFFVVLALALVHLSNYENRRRAAELFRRERLFVCGLLAMPIVLLFQVLVLRTGTFPALDPFLRFALVIPGFFFLATLPSRQLRLVQWGFVAGAVGVGAWAVYAHFHRAVWTYPDRLGNSFTNPIPFGDTALLLAFLSIASIHRGATVRSAEVAIKGAAFVLAGYASYLSGSRGGWIAAPLLLWVTVNGRHWLVTRRARLALGAAIIVAFAALASTSIVRERVDAVGADMEQMQRGNSDTSVGLRLQLWRASWLLFTRHPVFGVGRGRLVQGLDELARRGEASRAIVNAGGHSEFFSAISQTGTVGTVSLLLLYLGTLAPFWRDRCSSDGEIATAANLGIGVVGSTIIFGFTIDALTLVMNASFFSLTVATLLAWIEARKREIGADTGSRPLTLRRSPRTILISCPRRIGDVLLTTALVRSFKAKWPHAQVDMIVFRGTEGVLENNPDIRRVIAVAPRARLGERIVDALRILRRYDLACAAIDSDRALIYAALAGRKRIGLVNADRVKWFARLMLHRIALDRQLDAHTVSSSLLLPPLVGVAPIAELVAPGIGPDSRRRATFDARFEGTPAFRPGQPLVVLHPCPMYRYKQWTVDGWAATIRRFRGQGFAVALSGGPGDAERRYAEQVVEAAAEPVLNLVGELTLGETAELIRRAALFIGPDTGATHMAAACGTPTIALFGPTDPVRWAPWPRGWPAGSEPWPRRGSALRGNVFLLQGEGECVPCRGEGCDRHKESLSNCLTSLPVQRVIAAAQQLLGRPLQEDEHVVVPAFGSRGKAH